MAVERLDKILEALDILCDVADELTNYLELTPAASKDSDYRAVTYGVTAQARQAIADARELDKHQ